MFLATVLAAVVSLQSPAGPNAAEPYLAVRRDGTLMMSWLESGALRFASMKDGQWSAPRTIVEDEKLLVNWADFPSIVEDSRGVLFAQWLRTSGRHTYDAMLTSSSDGGKTWRAPKLINRDGKEAEHGFVSLVALPPGGVGLLWLDGREPGATMVRYAEFDAALNVTTESMLDARVCDCCATAMTMTPHGPLIAYRDRSLAEIRDIAFTRRVNGKWSNPARVRADNWKIPGCPVNGPQLDSRGEHAALAWFTAPENEPQVWVAFSRNAGATFDRAIRVDRANALGRVDVLMLDDASALVTWIEGENENAGIFVRRVFADGRAAEPVRLASTSSARASGFPRAALTGNTAYLAWADPAEKRIKVASMRVK